MRNCKMSTDKLFMSFSKERDEAEGVIRVTSTGRHHKPEVNFARDWTKMLSFVSYDYQ